GFAGKGVFFSPANKAKSAIPAIRIATAMARRMDRFMQVATSDSREGDPLATIGKPGMRRRPLPCGDDSGFRPLSTWDRAFPTLVAAASSVTGKAPRGWPAERENSPHSPLPFGFDPIAGLVKD